MSNAATTALTTHPSNANLTDPTTGNTVGTLQTFPGQGTTWQLTGLSHGQADTRHDALANANAAWALFTA